MMILPALALSLASPGSIVMSTGDCVVVAPLDGTDWIVEGSEGECGRRTLPASTFKIPHAVEQRVKEGLLALLMQGPAADEAITIGRKAAGR